MVTAGPRSYSFQLAPRDDNGARALSTLRDRGINLVANALAQSTDHILSFFNMLRTELAFYVGCLNLYGQLAAQGEPVCFPQPAAPEERRYSATGLYDVCLALRLGAGVVGNEVEADNKDFVIITGANQGGKSTLLRGIGLAQLMMQCGMFVPARTFYASVCKRIFTHYKREEDVAMSSGKFDEELSRMSDIIDDIRARFPCAVQRILCRDERARGLGDRPADRHRAGRRGHQGVLRHPSVRTRARVPCQKPAHRAVSAGRTPGGRCADVQDQRRAAAADELRGRFSATKRIFLGATTPEQQTPRRSDARGETPLEGGPGVVTGNA